MDIGDTAGWVGAATGIGALLLSVRQEVRANRKESAERQQAEAARLSIETSGDGDEGLLVEVRYRPEGSHTRFNARLTAVRPATAQLSAPRWESMSSAHIIMMPHRAVDWAADRHRSLVLPLEEEGPPGELAACVGVTGAPGKSIRLRVEIVDLADGSTPLVVERSLSA
jgi:hypothetical protein